MTKLSWVVKSNCIAKLVGGLVGLPAQSAPSVERRRPSHTSDCQPPRPSHPQGHSLLQQLCRWQEGMQPPDPAIFESLAYQARHPKSMAVLLLHQCSHHQAQPFTDKWQSLFPHSCRLWCHNNNGRSNDRCLHWPKNHGLPTMGEAPQASKSWQLKHQGRYT